MAPKRRTSSAKDLDAKGHTRCIKRMLDNHGPLYVAAMWPRDVVISRQEDEYSPWFVAHVDEGCLADEFIHSLYDEFEKSKDNTGEEVMENFSEFLSKKGYIVLNSSCANGRDNRIIIDRDRICGPQNERDSDG